MMGSGTPVGTMAYGTPVGTTHGTPVGTRVLFFEKGSVPFQEVSGWCFALVPCFGQAPMRGAAGAVEAEVSGLHHDDEAVVRQLTEPTNEVATVFLAAKLHRSVTLGQIDVAIITAVIPQPAAKRDIEAARAR